MFAESQIIGAAEIALLLFFGAVCVLLLYMIAFSIIAVIFGAVGFRSNWLWEDENLEMSVTLTIILWCIMLILGGICSWTTRTALWNASPFGFLQKILWRWLRLHIFVSNNAMNYSSMWSTFWSYLIISLFLSSFAVIFCLIFFGMKRPNSPAVN